MTNASEVSCRVLTIPGKNGLALHGRHWAVSDPRGVVVIAHGFGEHGACYDHVARAVGPMAGVDFVAPDLRGHGLSPGRRGVIRNYDDLVDDLFSAVQWAAKERPGLPLFVLGHSNGGLLALYAMLKAEATGRLAGVVVSNPALKLAFPVPKAQVRLGKILLRIAPWFTLPSPIVPENLTRDPVLQVWRRDDRLLHGRMSAPLFFGMREGSRLVSANAEKIRTPLLMILSGSDPVIDPNASRDVFERLGSLDKTLLLFPAMLHEPFNEVGREKVFADLASWLDARLIPDIDLRPA